MFAFNGDQHLLLPLYASGVFISFLLSQLGMVRHWLRVKGKSWRIKAAVNAFGTLVTGLTLVVIVIMKFTSGAWVTLLCILLCVFVMLRIKRHYDRVAQDLRLSSVEEARELVHNTKPGKAILPIQTINRSFIKTLDYALSCGFAEIELYSVVDSGEKGETLKKQVEELGVRVSFVYEVTPYRNVSEILLRHVETEAETLADDQNLMVMMSMLVVSKPAQRLLHNRTTQRLVRRMERYRNVSVFTVPYLI